MFKKIFINTGAQIFGKGVTASLSLIVAIIITRAITESGYGDFSKVEVFVGYFYTLADFGLNALYIKLSSSDSQIPLLKVLFGLRISMAMTLTLVAVAIGFLLPYNSATGVGFSPQVKLAIALYSLTIITQAMLTTVNAFFQKKLRYDFSTIAIVFGALSSVIGIIIVSATSPSILSYASIYVFSGVITILVAYFLVFKLSKQIVLPVFSLSQIKKIVGPAWPVGAALIVNLVYFRIDTFILASTRISSEVAVYNIAYKFFEAALTIPIFFSNSLYPLLTDLWQANVSQFKSKFKLWVKILTLISISSTAALAAGAYLIPFMFNGAYSQSVFTLQILSLGMPFFFLSAIFWHGLIIYGKQKYLIFIYAGGAIFNIVANIIFIPRYSYIAAAITTVASEGLVLALLIIVYMKWSKSD